MAKSKNGWLPRGAALFAMALYALWLWRCTEPRYALGDDYYLARAFAGEVGGVAETYNVYVHTVFAWLLHGLTRLFPGVWWFSWLQAALLLSGGFAVLLGLTRTAENSGYPGFAGFAVGVVFGWAYAMEFSVSVTYTTTAAVLGAGAVCLLGGVDMRASGRALAAPLVGSIALLWCAGMLRAVSLLPTLVFWLGLLLVKVLTAGTPADGSSVAVKSGASAGTDARERGGKTLRMRASGCRSLARVLIAALALSGLLIGVRLGENALTPAEDGYRAFFQARVGPTDYGGLEDISASTLEAVGWTEKETALVRSWYFLDENISAESFRRIGADAEAREKAPLFQRIKNGVKKVLALLDSAPNVRGFLLICLGLCAAAFLAACLSRSQSLWRFLAPVGCAGAALGLLFYLGFQGRLPIRAAAAVLLPGSAAALVLALEGLARCRGQRLRALPSLAMALGCLWLACSLGVDAFAFCHHPDHGDPDQCVFARVESYAMSQAETLFIGDRTLGVDVRMFPDRSQGVPVNLLPMWGGWNNHSQGYRAAFAARGLRHDAFRITDFMGGQVRLLTGAAGVSPEFLAYLEEQAGGPVTPVAEYEGDGFAVYRFQREDSPAIPEAASRGAADSTAP